MKRIILISMALACTGCSATCSEKTNNPEPEFEIQNSRTKYCVYGGLPMELQFNVRENPPKLIGKKLEYKDIDEFIEKIDASVANLLRNSVLAAYNKSKVNQETEWSEKLLFNFGFEILNEIQNRAPHDLRISFCGEKEEVGNIAYAAIFEYLLRATQLEDGKQPEWVYNHEIDSGLGLVLAITLGLRLADIEYDIEEILNSFSGNRWRETEFK